MGLFSKKPQDTGREYRGGCSGCDMYGPARGSIDKANKDAIDHGKRMHGGKPGHGGYVERRK